MNQPIAPTASPRRGAGWRRPRAVLALLFAVVSLVFSLLQLLGVGTIGGLLGPGVVSSSQVAGDIQRSVGLTR